MRSVLRKVLSMLLALCLWTALMPFSVLAAEGDVCEVDGTTYATLDDALDAVHPTGGGTIRLLENINYDGGIVIDREGITFDLDGFTLNVDNSAGPGLKVIGGGTVEFIDEGTTGSFNVTGTEYGVWADYGSVVWVNNVTASSESSCGVKATEYASIIVEGNVIATNTNSIGVGVESGGEVNVKGDVTANGIEGTGIKAYDVVCDEAEVIVEGDVTASGDDSVGVLAIDSYVTVGGNVTGDKGGVDAEDSGIEITRDVQSSDESGYGIRATDNCDIDIKGNVRSNGTGVLIWAEGTAAFSEITIDGVIDAPEYIRIGIDTFDFEDGYLDPDMIDGYRIYVDESLGAVLVAEFAGGSGSSEEDPYLVAHADQLYNVRNHLDKHFKLIEDIDLSGYSTGDGWEPIGDNIDPFTGTFDGGEEGYTISGLVIDRITTSYVGLFGCTGAEAEIRDLRLADVNVTGSVYVGGLVGRNYGQVTNSYATGDVTARSDGGGLMGQNEGSISDSYAIGTVTDVWSGTFGGLVGHNNGTITNCHAEVTVKSNESMVGGLVGENDGGISESYAVGEVEGKSEVGGLVGYNSDGNIDKSYATGAVTGTETGIYYTYVGGLVGINAGPISESYARGAVSGQEDIGGLVGYNSGSGSVTNSYATGTVNGYSYIGGLAGLNLGNIMDSYWDTETSLQSSSDGGTGKPTADMKQQKTYEEWDFDTIWGINASDNDGYPFLRWQGYDGGQTNEPPVLSAVGVSAVTQTTATLNFTSDKAGNYYFLVYSAGDNAPDAATIKAQGEAAAKGTGTAAAAANAAQVTGLTASTAYKAYVIVEDAEENISNVAVISFTTTTAEMPIGADISPALCTFDLENPDNVSTTISWGSATTVTAVVYGTTSLTTPADYNVSGNTLIITAGYLEGLNLSAGDTVGFEISFDVGDSASLTVNIVNGYVPGTDATLSDLKVGGVTVVGFVYDNYDYSIQLPYGT